MVMDESLQRGDVEFGVVATEMHGRFNLTEQSALSKLFFSLVTSYVRVQSKDFTGRWIYTSNRLIV